MKKYKITYFNGDISKPDYLTQISKSGKADGVRVWFYEDGKRDWQDNWKNDFRNGISRFWLRSSKAYCFRNWKKGNEQGIHIKFKFKQKNT